MPVTLEDLRQYRALKASIMAIEMEIESLYYPISSPPLMSDGSGKSLDPSDPTVRAFHQIEKDRERLDRKLKELSERKQIIDEWLDELQDGNIAAIIRYHFVIGLSWRHTCKQVYGYYDADTCRKAVARYFKQ